MIKRSKSYSTFSPDNIRDLGISMESMQHFPKPITVMQPSEWLKLTLQKNLRLPVITEKAKSELIVTPILTELHEQNSDIFTYFSGSALDVDKTIGLRGHCDFLLSRKPNAVLVESPVFSIIEAKNDGIEDAYPQCIAQLYAAELFNAKHGTSFPFIYGAVTTGFNWKFVRYADKTAYIDTDMYYMENLSELLGVLQHIILLYK